MAIEQLLPRQPRSGTLQFARPIAPALLGFGLRFVLDTTEALHNNPAESVQFFTQISFDNQATWEPESTAGQWFGVPVGLGKDGLPAVRALGFVIYRDKFGRIPTHARVSYVVIGTVNFGVIAETI